jgi:hypothetical protein
MRWRFRVKILKAYDAGNVGYLVLHVGWRVVGTLLGVGLVGITGLIILLALNVEIGRIVTKILGSGRVGVLTSRHALLVPRFYGKFLCPRAETTLICASLSFS